MADHSAGPAQHLPYAEMTSHGYAATAAASFVVEDYGEGVELLRGPCPRCGSLIEVPVFAGVVRTYRPQTGTPDADEDGVSEPVICTCTEKHEGRPEGRVGCGAYWNFVL